MCGFVLIQILLWQVLQFTARKLEQLVETGRKRLEVKNPQLEKELSAKERLQQQREERIDELDGGYGKCQSAKRPASDLFVLQIRDDEGYWQRLEAYIETHSDSQFSHGICHDCLAVHFPEVGAGQRFRT